MGHIKEPKGVDFIINSEPLTDKAREEISEFIRNYKSKLQLKKKTSSTRSNRAKAVSTNR